MLKRTTFVFFFTVYNLFALLNVVTAKERYIYWIDRVDDKIYCGDADGGHYEKVLSSRYVRLLTAAQGYIYYYEEDAIRRENMETRTVETLISETGRVSSMVIDTLNSTIYWSVSDSGKIWQADITGSNQQEFLCGLVLPNNLALDLVYENLYWMNDTRDTVYCAGLDGEKIRSVIEHNEKISDYVVDGKAHRIYFTDDNGRVLKSVNLDGNEEEIVYTFEIESFHRDLQLDSRNKKLYLTHHSQILRINTDGTELKELVNNYDLGSQYLSLDLSRGEMYWYTPLWTYTIYRSRLDGRNIEPVIVNYKNLTCLALDLEGEKMYWSGNFYNIYRSNIDGSEVEFLIYDFIANAELLDIDLDMVNQKLYFASAAEGQALGRANLDGTDVEFPYNVFWHWTFGITVDPSQEKVYWSQLGSTRTTSICCADLNGQNIEMPVDSLEFPDDIALNLRDNKIFWTEHLKVGRICCASLDGSDIHDVVTGLKWPCGLALDVEGNKIYWIEREPGKIKRANLDGTDIEELFSGLTWPYRLALSFENSGTTGVEKKDDGPNLIPQEFELAQNYPNPFNPETTIEYNLPKSSHIVLTVYDILGHEIITLVDEKQQAGLHQQNWNACDCFGNQVSSGIYVYKIKTDDDVCSKKMLYIK